MICYVYRSSRKPDTYLYTTKKDDFENLPETVLRVFGTPEFSMSFNLTADRKLAQHDAKLVIAKLESEGYFLQLPRADFHSEQIEKQIPDFRKDSTLTGESSGRQPDIDQ